MGAHSNYVSVESDLIMVICLIVATIICIIIYFTFKLITHIIKRHYYQKFRTEQHKVKQYQKISAQKDRAHQNTVDNFIYNRITEDMLHIGSKINTKLVELYREEV